MLQDDEAPRSPGSPAARARAGPFPPLSETALKQYTPDKIRNVAIVGHGGVGKTMLVEHMLYTSGASERVGTVDAGNTQSDFDSLEVRRKISVSASVLPLEWHGHKINLIDIPGYPDFIGDLHAAARVADAMIIVCEAKRDLDVGFDLAWEAAEAEGLARCVFVNKLERDNADYEGLLETLHARFGNRIVDIQVPIGHQATFSGILDLLNMKVYKGKDRGDAVEELPAAYKSIAEERREAMMDAAAEGDDDLAMKYLEGEQLSPEEIEHGLLVGIKSGKVVPMLIGSAASGMGVAPLLDRIVAELPSPVDRKVETLDERIECDPAGPFVGFVFKTTADPYVGKINYIRVFRGTLRADDHVQNVTHDQDERIHNLFFPHGKAQEAASVVVAGDICAVAKLQDTHTSDTLCDPKHPVQLPPIAFPAPIYRVAVKPATKADEDKLGTAIERLLDEDPTLRYTREVSLHQEILEGMGDIHIDTAIEKLKARFGVTVLPEDAKVPYRETIRSTAKAQGKHKRQTGGRGQFGDCWLELSPRGRGEGFLFESKIVGGAIPKNYIPAIEKGVRETMEKGFLAGYPVHDVHVVVYDGSYHEVDSSEQAFKIAGSLGFRNAADKANPVILEPILKLEVEVPEDSVGDVVGDLNTRRGQMQGIEAAAPGKQRVMAIVPMATMMRYALDLRSITKGRGRFSAEVSHYDEMPAHEANQLVAAYEKAKKEEED